MITTNLLDYASILTAPAEKFPDYTPNRIHHEDATLCLRVYGEGDRGIPTLIVNPKAGHGRLSDHGPGQSLVRTVRSSVGGPVYELDWKSCTFENRSSSIDHLITRIMLCGELVGEPFRIVGLCAGGWMSAIYTALFPQNVTEIVTIGAPIDFAAGGGDIQKFVQNTPVGFFNLLVRLGGGMMRGEWMLAAWKGRNWIDRYITDYWKWWALAMEPASKEKQRKIEKVRRYRRWYENSINLGGWYAQACEELFRDNRLVKGELRVLGQKVNLRRITQPWTRLWGDRDDITLKDQAFFSPAYVSGATHDVVIPGKGHIGCFISETAQPLIARALQSVIHNELWGHWAGQE